MKILNIIVLNANNYSLEDLLKSPYLNDENIKEIEKITHPLAKKEKTASFILKNKYVGKYYIREDGKPVSDSCYFSVSHSFGLTMIVIDDKPVGIDVEKIREVDDKMIDYVSSKEEKEYINNSETFFEVWTSKESLLKCLGIGIRTKLKEINSLPIDGFKTYDGRTYCNRSVRYEDYVVSIIDENHERFHITFVEETI